MSSLNGSQSLQSAPLRWAKPVLIAAGIYNLLWGAVVIFAPNLFFDIAGMEPMRYPQIWQCVGMIVGVYGIGYIIASGDSRRHWPIVLVGLVGKVLGPIGFAIEISKGTFSPVFGLTILTNDLIWWVPFGMILWDAARHHGSSIESEQSSLDEVMNTIHDQSENSLATLSAQRPTLVVFTRHSGCTFCKEMLTDLANKKATIDQRGYGIAVVTMSDAQTNEELARSFNLVDCSWISDPDRRAYSAFQLGRGSFLELFGPKVIMRGFIATLRGHFAGKLDGDGFQMPGAFLIKDGRIIESFRSKTASDHPNYDQMVCEIA
jgi:peroxiredoxin